MVSRVVELSNTLSAIRGIREATLIATPMARRRLERAGRAGSPGFDAHPGASLKVKRYAEIPKMYSTFGNLKEEGD